MKTIAILLLAAGTALAGPKPKPIDPAQTKANDLFEKGLADFQTGDFQAAITLFKDAYALVHDPVYLFNIAQAYRKVLDCEAASEHYNRYLTDATDADAKQRDKVGQWLRELQPCVEARQREHDEARRGAEALKLRQDEEDRKHRAAAPMKIVEVDRGGGYRMAGLATAAAGGLLLILGTYETLHSRSLKSEVAMCGTGCNWADYADADASGHTANKLAAIGWIGGGVLAAGGAVLYYLGVNRMERVQVAPTATGAAVSIRF